MAIGHAYIHHIGSMHNYFIAHFVKRDAKHLQPNELFAYGIAVNQVNNR